MDDEVPEKIELHGMICERIPEKKAKVEKKVELRDCLNDPRFQQQNKTKWCYTMFVDFHRCSHYLGEDHEHCKYFFKCYNILCPQAWIDKWDDQVKQGTFPRDLTREMG